MEIFSDSTDEGSVFEAAVMADASGNFTWSGIPSGPYLTATVTDASGNTSSFSDPLTVTGVLENTPSIPSGFSLSENFPNPFNATATIRFAVPEEAAVFLRVYDAAGRKVSTLTDRKYPPGEHTVRFDAFGIPSGLYVCRMDAGTFTASRKMVLMK